MDIVFIILKNRPLSLAGQWVSVSTGKTVNPDGRMRVRGVCHRLSNFLRYLLYIIRRILASGKWHRLHRGGFAVGKYGIPWDGKWLPFPGRRASGKVGGRFRRPPCGGAMPAANRKEPDSAGAWLPLSSDESVSSVVCIRWRTAGRHGVWQPPQRMVADRPGQPGGGAVRPRGSSGCRAKRGSWKCGNGSP